MKVGGWGFGAIANVGAIDLGGVLTKLVHLGRYQVGRLCLLKR